MISVFLFVVITHDVGAERRRQLVREVGIRQLNDIIS